MSLQRGINLRSLAEKMGQCSGAEVRGICTEAGMYALRERRQHVTQEDFEFAIAKVHNPTLLGRVRADTYILSIGAEEEPGRKYIRQQAVLVVEFVVCIVFYYFAGEPPRIWRKALLLVKLSSPYPDLRYVSLRRLSPRDGTSP